MKSPQIQTKIESEKEKAANVLRAAIQIREGIIRDLEKKGLATRNSYGHVVNRDTHPLRVTNWMRAESAYCSAMHEAEEKGAIKIHNHSFSWL